MQKKQPSKKALRVIHVITYQSLLHLLSEKHFNQTTVRFWRLMKHLVYLWPIGIQSQHSTGYELSFGSSHAWACRLRPENNCYLTYYHIVLYYYIIIYYIIISHCHIRVTPLQSKLMTPSV